MRRLLRLLWTGFAGALCATSLPTSVIAVGWTQRFMQRASLRHWHRTAESPLAWESFALEADETRPLASAPGWVLGAKPRSGIRGYLGSLGRNVSRGFAVTLNTWVLTVPGCALWLFAWYDGWNNSFHKGYEQAAVGPAVGLLGVALFIAAMLYVPLAQARQAATGEWRSFYAFSLVWRLVRLHGWANLRLAALYALVSVPVIALKTAPIAFDRLPAYPQWSDAEALAVLQTYFFWAGAFVFAAYVWLHARAARLYADAVVAGVRAGLVAPEELGSFEQRALARLDLLRADPAPERHALTRAALRIAGVPLRGGAVAAAALVWVAFVAQIFVSEFLNYHPVIGWLNQPLVQLPWFRYLPPGL